MLSRTEELRERAPSCPRCEKVTLPAGGCPSTLRCSWVEHGTGSTHQCHSSSLCYSLQKTLEGILTSKGQHSNFSNGTWLLERGWSSPWVMAPGQRSSVDGSPWWDPSPWVGFWRWPCWLSLSAGAELSRFAVPWEICPRSNAGISTSRVK